MTIQSQSPGRRARISNGSMGGATLRRSSRRHLLSLAALAAAAVRASPETTKSGLRQQQFVVGKAFSVGSGGVSAVSEEGNGQCISSSSRSVVVGEGGVPIHPSSPRHDSKVTLAATAEGCTQDEVTAPYKTAMPAMATRSRSAVATTASPAASLGVSATPCAASPQVHMRSDISADNNRNDAQTSNPHYHRDGQQQRQFHDVGTLEAAAATAAAAAANGEPGGGEGRKPLFRRFLGGSSRNGCRGERGCRHRLNKKEPWRGRQPPTGAVAAASVVAAGTDCSTVASGPKSRHKHMLQQGLSSATVATHPPYSPPTTKTRGQGAGAGAQQARHSTRTQTQRQGQAHGQSKRGVVGAGAGAGAVGRGGTPLDGGTVQEDVGTRSTDSLPSTPHGDCTPEPTEYFLDQDPQSGMVLHGTGGVGGAVNGAEGGGIPEDSISEALWKLCALLLPEMLRVAKIVAISGLVFRAMREIGSVFVARFRRPPKANGQQERRKTADGRRGEKEMGGDSIWDRRDRAQEGRQSLLMKARGMHVPEAVLADLDEYEIEVAKDLVDCDGLDVTFEDIAGLENIKNDLQEIISEPLELSPDLYPARLIQPCNGILIYGPSGCGKTFLARAIARQSGAAFISVKASTLMRRPPGSGGGKRGAAGARRAGVGVGVGHSSIMVRALFSLAAKIQPCIIFFDEADGMCFKREEGDSGPDREVMTELMQLWDELASSGKDRVVILAATNRPWDLDPAVQRRFSRSFQVGLPDRKMRRAVLKKALEDVDVEDGFDWRELAANTEGYSCADLVELCREAVRGPLREAMERNRRRASRRFNDEVDHQGESPLRQQQEQVSPHRRTRQDWQREMDFASGHRDRSTPSSHRTWTTAAQSAPSVRMRPLRMSDMAAAQKRVVPAFWQAEAYRATFESYMASLMEHARQHWSR